MLLKIKLAFDNGFIFAENFYDREEDDRCKVYDSNEVYLGYISVANKNESDYLQDIEHLKTYKDINKLCTYLIGARFYCSKTLKGIFEHFLEKDALYGSEEDYKDQYIHDLITLKEFEILVKYDLNKVGGYYVYQQ